MASFRTEELAIRLGPFNEVENNGYQLLIVCTEISALNEGTCSGTNPVKTLTGALDKKANLLKLKTALDAALREVDDRIRALPPTPS